ncbi:hypothetical protein JCM11251_005608 [Rhodosporidiobolus azoricus]
MAVPSSSPSSSSPRSPPSTSSNFRSFPTPLLRSFIQSRIFSPSNVGDLVWERDAGRLVGGGGGGEGGEKGLVDRWAGEVRARMAELEPTGWKYFCQVAVSERPPGSCSSSSASAGKAVVSTFWDPHSDVCVSEVFQNDTVVITVLAVAIRIQY